MKLHGALLFAVLAGAAMPNKPVNTSELIELARNAIVQDYAARDIKITLNDIIAKPMDQVIEPGSEGTVYEFGFGLPEIVLDESGVGEYCSVRILQTENQTAVTDVDCGAYD